ncbi:hypothetical protein PUN28_009129 [Cardiocondyla obscurior]|uniref:RNA helicase n=1 Tax=Cardiocondyla obscurior TaxID=286306 RepID=A0AAW2FW54_9HYME
MDFWSIQQMKDFSAEGENKSVKSYDMNIERSEDNEDIKDDLPRYLEIAKRMWQICDTQELQNVQPPVSLLSNRQYDLIPMPPSNSFSVNMYLNNQNQEIRQPKIFKLRSKGFYESHCAEALINTNGNLDDAMEMLFYKYYDVADIPRFKHFEVPNDVELLRIRQQEKQILESVFHNAFVEKIENHIWMFQLELRYLTNDTSESSYFTLEIRFPKECIYPYEPPYIYFSKDDGIFSRINCLRIARRLHNEACLCSFYGIPSMHFIISLLTNKNEIKAYLEINKEPFLHPLESLCNDTQDKQKKIDVFIRLFETEVKMILKEIAKEGMLNCFNPPSTREQTKDKEKEKEKEIKLLEPLHTKEREVNGIRGKENVFVIYLRELLFAKKQENREESVNKYVLELPQAKTRQKEEESTSNSYVQVPRYRDMQRVDRKNFLKFNSIETNRNNVTFKHNTEKKSYPANMLAECDKIKQSLISLDVSSFSSNVITPLHAEKSEKQEKIMINPEECVALHVQISKKREENTLNPGEFTPLCTKKSQNEKDNIIYSNIVLPLCTENLRKDENNITHSDIFLPLCAEGPQKEDNTINSDMSLPLQAEKSQKEEENIINSNIVSSLCAEEPQKKDNLIKFDMLSPSCAEKLQKEENNIINSNVLLSLHVEKPQKEEDSITNFDIPCSLYVENQEKKEENISNPHPSEPLCKDRLEKSESNTTNFNTLETLCSEKSEKKDRNMPSFDVHVPLHTEEPDKREANVPDSSVSLGNFNTTNNYYSFYRYFGCNKYLGNNMTLQDEENMIIKETFTCKQSNSKYKNMQTARKKLPSWDKKDEILKAVHENQVVIVSGETGCGKSTQVPQFILDDWIINRIEKEHINIICVQPRKICTVVLATRIAEERADKLGEVVGYHVRLEKRRSSMTRLLFCTTGILLQQIMRDPQLTDVTHVIFDEVHERNAESDFLLMLMKDLLPKKPTLKIILMSATLNVDPFCAYFGDVPVLNIAGASFSVKQIFLEDVLEQTGYILDENSKYVSMDKINQIMSSEISNSISEAANASDDDYASEKCRDDELTVTQLMRRYPDYSKQTYINLYFMNYEKINYDLIEHILEWIITGKHEYPKEGSILIFLPGWNEISALKDQLDNSILSQRGKIMIVPLHSSLSIDDQKRVFLKAKKGVHKVVISTNLAETSITINDCVYVIDSGKMKESRFNSNRNMECLEACWVTQANVKQRKGRAGRVMPGVCIHLYTSYSYEQFAAYQIPEIQRISLEKLLLYLASLKWKRDDLYVIMQKMIDSPSFFEITGAINRLQEIGAFDSDYNLTALGYHLNKLPVNVRIGKLILYGAMFSCLDSVLTIAACLSHKSPFSVPLEKKDKINPRIKFFSANSDHLTTLYAYWEWQKVLYFRGKVAARKFAQENYLSVNTLYNIADLKYQFLELLVSIGFVSVSLPKRQSNTDNIIVLTGQELNKNNTNLKLLQGLLCAALYPNIARFKTSQGVTSKESRFLLQTRNGDIVRIHPSSVNSTVKSFTDSFIVYQQKVRTTQVYIVEVSIIPTIAITLFADYELWLNVSFDDTSMITLDPDWINIKLERDHFRMLQNMRLHLAILIMKKMENPLLDFSIDSTGGYIINKFIQMVSNS